jgi:hypothetical protein
MALVQAITFKRLPHKFFWDEEGTGAFFEAWDVPSDDSKVRLYIHHDSTGKWIDAELDRQVVIDTFMTPLSEFGKRLGLPTRGDWHLSIFELNGFEQLKKRGVAPRSDVTSALPIRFLMQGGNAIEHPVTWMYCQVFDLDSPAICMINDTDPFWTDWFDFLEKIVRGNFPAEIANVNSDWVKEIKKEILEGDITGVNVDRPFGKILLAFPVAHPGHFRFQILETDLGHLHFPIIDEVLNQRQFVAEFCNVFEDFLETQYRVFADENGEVFDLRTLPLDRLKALL